MKYISFFEKAGRFAKNIGNVGCKFKLSFSEYKIGIKLCVPIELRTTITVRRRGPKILIFSLKTGHRFDLKNITIGINKCFKKFFFYTNSYLYYFMTRSGELTIYYLLSRVFEFRILPFNYTYLDNSHCILCKINFSFWRNFNEIFISV